MEEKVNILWFWYIQAPLITLQAIILISAVLAVVKLVKPAWFNKLMDILGRQF